MKCKQCGETTSPPEAVTSALNIIKEQTGEDIYLPLSNNLKDIAALQTAYDMSCTSEDLENLG